MGTIIVGATSAIGADVDSEKNLRVRARAGMLDLSAAASVYVTYTGIYSTCTHMIHTSAGTNGGYYWNMRGPATGAAYILYMNQHAFASITTAANTQPYWDWRDQTGAASPSGGSSQVIHKYDSRYGNSACVNIQGSGGGTTALTMTGITATTVPWFIVGSATSNGMGNPLAIDMTLGGISAGWRVAADQHWSMRLGSGVAGWGNSGFVIWAEGTDAAA